ncbi:MAG: twin-arginine translocase TatA/TatE family subunit [Chloroflexota bacterium]
MRFGPTELFIILLIVLVLFGGGRIARLGNEMGEAVSSFRKGLRSGKDAEENEGEDKEDVKASENGKEPV